MKKHILFVPHSPEQSINALIFARKLANTASALGHITNVAQSIEELESTNADTIIIIGKKPPSSDALKTKNIAIIGLDQTQYDATTVVNDALANTAHLDEISQDISVGATRFVAITACPTGVAHTFMAAEALQQGAVKHGYTIDVETQGSVGAKNILSPESIAAADIVILATDIEVNTDRFVGKRVYRCGTGFALKQTDKAFEAAIKEAKVLDGQQASKEASDKKEKVGLYKHLLTGVSFMLPVVIAGGLLLALSLCFGLNAAEKAGTLGFYLHEIGKTAFSLMVPVLSGYIAYSIADRPGLTPGLIGGLLASQIGAGFLGGIASGFLAGYIALLLVKKLKLPANFESLKPILVIPLLATMCVGLLMLCVLGTPIKEIFDALTAYLRAMDQTDLVFMGLILGGMMCVDFGGPINKAAYMIGVGLLSEHNGLPIAIAMAAGMVPPIGLALATFFAKNKFDQTERDTGKTAFILGLCFVSEGAIPFATKDPIRVLPSSIIGGAVTGILVAISGCILQSAHGGVFVLIIPNAINHPLMYLGAIATGSVTTGLIYAFLKQSQNNVAITTK